jgi:hypothetical protein
MIKGNDTYRRPATGGVRATPAQFLGPITFLVLAVGVISLLSYSLTASELMRADNPTLAAWWEAHQFYLMEGAATAFGLLLGIRIGSSFVVRFARQSGAWMAALVFSIIIFPPLIHVCASAARLGWNGRGASVASWIISREGYDMGRQIDKVMIAGIYFFKTAGFALLAGLGLMAIACAAVLAVESTNTKVDT